MVRAVPLVKGILGISASPPPARPGMPRLRLGRPLHIDYQAKPKETHMSVPTENSAGTTAIRPFTVPVTPDAELDALRARVAATRWPDRELVTDHSQGVQLATITALADYWAAEYD